MKKRFILAAFTGSMLAAFARDQTGRQQFIICGACHGQNGEGTAAAPPLAGSEWVNGPPENLIRIQLRGLTGPITVKGMEFTSAAGMMPLAYQTDEQIAAVLTHIRSSFGNRASAVTAAEVAALRSEVGKPPLTQGDLIPVAQTATVLKPASSKYADLETAAGPPATWIVAAAAMILGIIGLLVVKKNRHPH